MKRILAHPAYLFIGIAGAESTALIGLYCGVKDKDVLNMDAEDWFGLSAVHMLVAIASLVARILIVIEEKGL